MHETQDLGIRHHPRQIFLGGGEEGEGGRVFNKICSNMIPLLILNRMSPVTFTSSCIKKTSL